MRADLDQLDLSVRRGILALRKTEREIGVAYALVDATVMIEAGLRYLKEVFEEKDATERVVMLLDRTQVLPYPDVLAAARPAEYWSERLAEAGAPISPADIRKRALAKGMFFEVNKAILISPGQLDAIFRSSRKPAEPESKAANMVLAKLRAKRRRVTRKKQKRLGRP
ncbi:hypothetical protein [Chelativorans alearense]|uniref:hypothetical protein n=1 Tax=Chelativorans alearense TaxID=2681495 RepID=UPI0013D57745|nr:hypothetical protein [Chelativorans alearense]